MKKAYIESIGDFNLYEIGRNEAARMIRYARRCYKVTYSDTKIILHDSAGYKQHVIITHLPK